MSCAYNVQCLDCDGTDPGGTDRPIGERRGINHGDDWCRWLVEHRAVWEALGEAEASAPDSALSLGHDIGRHFGYSIRAEWFRRHKGHRLMIIDEYGMVDGSCGKTLVCGACKREHGKCCKPAGHHGECA
jgi:hypothetical protein